MKYCPVCETDYPDDVNVCPQDGAAVRRPGERPDPFVGRVIKGRYKVERQLGRGGMGTVYLAEQLSVGRKVALKVLRGDFARDEGFVARFQQEAKLVAGLNEKRNPRVTLVHDFDQAEDGSVFIVMEWLDGRALSEVIQRGGPLDLSRAVKLATQIAEGLEAAHRSNVVHRDVKPQNIMVLDSSDDIKLMDFGIARLRDSGRTSLTRAGTMMGTPDYMAPEQIEGQEITDRTDIYSFGIVFYEMLTGMVPFRAATQSAVLTKQLQEQPVPPSQLRPGIPREVEAIVLRALAKNPAQRGRDMGEIVQALRQVPSELLEESGPERAGGGATIIVSPAGGVPAETLALTVRGATMSTVTRPRPSRDALSTPTLSGHEGNGSEVPPETPPAASTGRTSQLWKGLAIGGVVAVVLAGGVATVVYLVSVPPPISSPVQRDNAPESPASAQSAQMSAPPQVSSVAPVGAIVPPKPPELANPPDPVPGRPRPVPEKRPQTGTPKTSLPSHPPAVVAKPRAEGQQARVVPPAEPGAPNIDRLRAQVEDRLRRRGLLRGSGSDPNTGLTVEVGPNGVVTLRGIVRDAAQRDEAATLARLDGVSEVRLRVNVQSSWN
jgi:serine/threonine-protein kinase